MRRPERNFPYVKKAICVPTTVRWNCSLSVIDIQRPSKVRKVFVDDVKLSFNNVNIHNRGSEMHVFSNHYGLSGRWPMTCEIIHATMSHRRERGKVREVLRCSGTRTIRNREQVVSQPTLRTRVPQTDDLIAEQRRDRERLFRD